jgi:hypothetical protein
MAAFGQPNQSTNGTTTHQEVPLDGGVPIKVKARVAHTLPPSLAASLEIAALNPEIIERPGNYAGNA